MGAGTLLHAVTRRPERFRRIALVLPPAAWATRAAQADGYRQTPPPPDVDERLLSAVLRGAADADFPDQEAIAAIQQPVLLLPWTDDPGHPVSTAEQLHDLLPNSTLKLTQTIEDLRAIGTTVATFLGPAQLLRAVLAFSSCARPTTCSPANRRHGQARPVPWTRGT